MGGLHAVNERVDTRTGAPADGIEKAPTRVAWGLVTWGEWVPQSSFEDSTGITREILHDQILSRHLLHSTVQHATEPGQLTGPVPLPTAGCAPSRPVVDTHTQPALITAVHGQRWSPHR